MTLYCKIRIKEIAHLSLFVQLDTTPIIDKCNFFTDYRFLTIHQGAFSVGRVQLIGSWWKSSLQSFQTFERERHTLIGNLNLSSIAKHCPPMHLKHYLLIKFHHYESGHLKAFFKKGNWTIISVMLPEGIIWQEIYMMGNYSHSTLKER